MPSGFDLFRYLVFAGVALVGVAAAGAMAIQRRKLNPFGRTARTVRDLTDPMIKPIERRILRAGGNPQSAPLWLGGAAIVGGIVLVTGAEWLVGQVAVLRYAAAGGGLVVVLVNWTFNLLMLALIVRVVGSWFGASRYTPWMKPFYAATEWLLGPIRRVLPPFGPFDFSPLVAWLVLSLLRPWILRLL